VIDKESQKQFDTYARIVIAGQRSNTLLHLAQPDADQFFAGDSGTTPTTRYCFASFEREEGSVSPRSQDLAAMFRTRQYMSAIFNYLKASSSR
jgi:hypothetical protein